MVRLHPLQPLTETNNTMSDNIETPAIETAVIETPAVETSALETPAIETPPLETAPAEFPTKYLKDGKPDFAALTKGYKELESKLGKGLALDVPATAADYQLKPEKLPDGLTWSEQTAGKFAEVFHANGVPKAAARGIVDTFMELEARNLAEATAAYDTQLKADRTKLEEEWGGADNYQKHAAKIGGLVVGSLGEDPGDAVLFSNPRIMRFLGKVVDQLGEDAQAALAGGVAPGATFTDGSSLARRIMSDASHPEHANYMNGDTATIRKVQRLLDGEN
jgi:hypothetical protein